MEELFQALIQMGGPVRELVSALIDLVIPWTPLAAWIIFWLFAVNWTKFHQVIFSGGWLGLVLIGLVWVLVWGCVAPPLTETRNLFGLHVSNFVEKTVYVAGLYCIMFAAGSLQLSGFCRECCQFEPAEAPPESHGGGHDDHAHAAAHH